MRISTCLLFFFCPALWVIEERIGCKCVGRNVLQLGWLLIAPGEGCRSVLYKTWETYKYQQCSQGQRSLSWMESMSLRLLHRRIKWPFSHWIFWQLSVAGTDVSPSQVCHTAAAHQRPSPCEDSLKPGKKDTWNAHGSTICMLVYILVNCGTGRSRSQDPISETM